MTKFLDTSNMIKYETGNNKGHFNWTENIGKELKFQYDDLTGVIKIVAYKSVNRKNLITIQYKDNIITTSTSNLLQLKIPSFLNKNKNNKNYKYKENDLIDKDFQISKIIKQTKISYNSGTVRGYQVQCLNCNYIYETREDKMSSCPVCGIRTTYSERFIHSIFIQANIKFEVQKEFEWLHNYWYDVYLPNLNAIVEINGLQHFEPVKLKDRECKPIEQVFEKCTEHDNLKMNMALKNNLLYYIIDARDQNKLYDEAKNVLSFIDFSKVSKFECEKFAITNKIKKTCDLWNKGYTLEDISSQLQYSISKVQAQLRLGNNYNICIYDKIINMKNHKVTNPNATI